MGEINENNLPKVESNGHLLNCEIDRSFTAWEKCYITKENFPIEHEYVLNIYDQCNILYDYHPSFYVTESINNFGQFYYSINIVIYLVILLLI